MLPPMAIFFPLFTILEDLGYLPRVAFNLDFLFRRAGAHGKQALTMAMGFGCNAAGIIATRVIDSPRERLVAILTNNFVPCNGRFPTLIMLATIFVGGRVSAGVRVDRRRRRRRRRRGDRRRLHAADVVGAVAHDPERRSVGVHARAAAVPAPGRRAHPLHVADRSDAVRAVARDADRGAGRRRHLDARQHLRRRHEPRAAHRELSCNPLGQAIGLDGVILLAYIIAIPANEIVVPTMLMVYMGTGMMTELDSIDDLRTLLVDQNGWTLLTAVNLMLFSLLHNPCATTILTIYKETLSAQVGDDRRADAARRRVPRDVPAPRRLARLSRVGADETVEAVDPR